MASDRQHPIARLFIPEYDELSLFVMSLTFILLYKWDRDLVEESLAFASSLVEGGTIYSIICIVFFGLGLIYSFSHVLIDRKKTSHEKTAMLLFAVAANGFAGISASMYMWDDYRGFLMVFPAWNLLSGGLLILLFLTKEIDEDVVSDEDVTFLQALVASGIAVLVLYICHFQLRLYWAITFSIAVAYASSLTGVIQSMIPGGQCAARAVSASEHRSNGRTP